LAVVHSKIAMRFLSGAKAWAATDEGAMAATTTQADEVSFGPFSLVASERRLTNDGMPVELGGRALDILIALVSRPNEVVSKNDLLSQVWPDVTVEESSLRFHMASLRKALGDGKDGARYITTLTGRGYCFVAPISRSSGRSSARAAVSVGSPYANLPPRLTRMVGRGDDVLRLLTLLNAERFITIVGTGGIGKTTVAVAVGNDLIEAFAGAVLFVDLGMLSDPKLVPSAVASLLGLSIQSDDATPSLIAYLRENRILLILDTCEHLIEAVAALAFRIFNAAPQVHILATSREALQVEGEFIYKLDPLAYPPDDEEVTAAVARAFPATELFIERAAASGARLEFSDAEAGTVSSICRKLDGVALAIELAARRVESYGLENLAALLDQHVTLRWPGQRIAPLRQKTLQATLDWSYGLLSDLERLVLRRLAVFVGHFSVDAALAVATGPNVDRARVFGAIDSLVAKSMVATRPIGAMMRYRLLDTTRAYLLEIGNAQTEGADLAERHANYYRRWLEQTGTELSTSPTPAERAFQFAGLNNVRAALEWCFGPDGNAATRVGLAAAAAPVFLAMSLLTECHRWSDRAILALTDDTCGGKEEMHLQAAVGVSLMFTRGGAAAAGVALRRSFAIAEQCGDAFDQLQVLGPLQMFYHRIGEFKAAVHHAKRGSALAKDLEDSVAITSAHSLMCISHFMSGELGIARSEGEAALKRGRGSQRTSTIYLGFDGVNLAGVVLASTLWLQGYPIQALELARQTVKDAARMDHGLTLALALIWSVYVFLWTGDLQSAEEHTDWLMSRAESRSLGPYLAVGRGFRGQLAILRGDARRGIESLRDCLREFHATPYEVQTTPFSISLAEGLAAIGQLADGLTLIEQTIRNVEANGDYCYMPEALRVKAGLLLSMPKPSLADAEACLVHSLELSRRQGARAWELRTVTDLARLWSARGRGQDARALLQPIFEQFTKGLDTADLKAAKALLETLT
jgi:predicted ATPase/DNA-binding winged helix-turn-helix (wHTH) protein